MAKRKEPINPFYVLLVILGIAFLITACAYGVMAFRGVHSYQPASDGPEHPLTSFLRQHGDLLLLVEVILLALASFAAMGIDHLWNRRSEAENPRGGGREEPGGADRERP